MREVVTTVLDTVGLFGVALGAGFGLAGWILGDRLPLAYGVAGLAAGGVLMVGSWLAGRP